MSKHVHAAFSLASVGTRSRYSLAIANTSKRRTLTGQPDVLQGFEQTFVEIDNDSVQSLTGKSRHVLAKFTGRRAGAVWNCTILACRLADARHL